MKLKVGQQVEIYRNLNRKGLWFSVRDKKSGLVIHRVNLKDGDRLLLKNAKFHVSAAGRKRVLEEKRKNVHALIRAEIAVDLRYDGASIDVTTPFIVTYNPYTNDTFMAHLISGKVHMSSPIERADWVTLDENGVRAWVNLSPSIR